MARTKQRVAKRENIRTKTRSAYLAWLKNLVGCKGYFDENKTYHFLFNRLYEIEFYFTNAMDSNRNTEGRSLRNQWEMLVRENYSALDIYSDPNDDYDFSALDTYSSVSILEVLIAMCIKYENSVAYNPKKGDRTRFWFWNLMQLSGLDAFDDCSYNADSPLEIYAICEDILKNRVRLFGEDLVDWSKPSTDGYAEKSNKVLRTRTDESVTETRRTDFWSLMCQNFADLT